MLGVMKNPESIMVGIDIKRDIFIELYLLYPKTLKPVIVIPDLDVPGIRDIAWKIPTIKALLKSQLSIVLFFNSYPLSENLRKSL